MSEHEAGRALDALIAERVFGWTQIRPEGRGLLRGRPAEWENRGNPFRKVPHYSTDIAAAFAMEEKLIADGHAEVYAECVVQEALNGKDPLVFTDEQVAALIHATPLQRCRAAIKAMEWLDAEARRA